MRDEYDSQTGLTRAQTSSQQARFMISGVSRLATTRSLSLAATSSRVMTDYSTTLVSDLLGFTDSNKANKQALPSSPVAAMHQMVLNAGKDEWLGASTEDKAEVFQWMSTAQKTIIPSLQVADKRDAVFMDLNTHLTKRTFIVSNQPTVADISLFAALHIPMKRFAPTLQDQAPNLVRWFDLIQHLVHSAQLNPHGHHVSIPLVVIDTNATRDVGTVEQNAKSQKKVEKGDAKGDDKAAEKGKKKEAAAAPKAEDKKEVKKEAAAAPAKEKGKEKVEKKAASSVPPEAAGGDDVVDPSKVDIRVGLIRKVEKHKDADTLYVEEVDLGTETRTVVSGLVKYIPDANDLLNKQCLFVCNLKPAKMRGVESQAMLLACTDPVSGKLELLAPPAGSKPGDKAFWENYPGTPEAQLNPKKKTWEGIVPLLKTDAQKRATFTGPDGKIGILKTDKGDVTVPSIVGGGIR
ncbi:hypothetical protein SmJEL517_g01635 [Synchytrium microbalum]|uniref:tRNA-binding domain-containing protein n=1 Tax=Synchytrium microbalum TaxID=1806994 RepID=A0A507CE31_9FUNG|nr:uncharacterized protein SmJEL517_g01635 [Synchytrium microbalum]TPX36184.1 hypothetical protein SmJEL517_g01635 [Synchytrium microbalum]